MLKSLKVKNYALISDVQLEFNSGLNIITGETGAGKSILMDALGLSLGQRADTTALRNKEKKCVIEALFAIEKLNLLAFFVENDLDYEPLTILRREITSNGKSRSFINDTPVNLKQLSDLGALLIEIHSQYDNLQLFTSKFQFNLVDSLAGSLAKQNDYYADYQQWLLLKHKLNELQLRESDFNRERDFNQFLFDELEAAQLNIEEEEGLEQERNLLENAESLIHIFQESQYILSEGENAVNPNLAALIKLFGQSGNNALTELVQRLKSSLIELEDISNEIDILASRVEINPERLELINDRIGLLHNLKHKHRVDSIAGLIQIKNALEDKLQESTSLADTVTQTMKEIEGYEHKLSEGADELHMLRLNSLNNIHQDLNGDLNAVGMAHSLLRIDLVKNQELGPFGWDAIQFNLSSDKGENFAPIKKSASGGELARINLIVKNRLARYNALACSVFDEIDTGVSGEIARKVGGVMTEMGQFQQIIAITHLPQIASLGGNHLFVYKEVGSQGVSTHVRNLKGEDRIYEIAKMISGEQLTESAIEQSKSLLS